jgi:hypothetical protein
MWLLNGLKKIQYYLGYVKKGTKTVEALMKAVDILSNDCIKIWSNEKSLQTNSNASASSSSADNTIEKNGE